MAFLAFFPVLRLGLSLHLLDGSHTAHCQCVTYEPPRSAGDRDDIRVRFQSYPCTQEAVVMKGLIGPPFSRYLRDLWLSATLS